jgi:alpha-mannosidase
MKVRGFHTLAGEFTLASPAAAAEIAGVGRRELPPVRIVEDGPVRTVVEALFEHGRSALCLRYKLPAEGTEIEIEAQVSWHETDRLLKLSFPTACAGGEVLCQVAYGVERVRRETEEAVGHRWQALLTPDGRHALTLVNDATYGFDAAEGDLRVSLLRAPAYAGHPVDDETPIVRQDRFEPREDQGPHRFRFWLNAGPAASRLAAIDQESLLRPEGVTALGVFPPGGASRTVPGLVLSDAAVRLAALKMSEDGTRLVVRLFETTGAGRRVVVHVPALDLSFDVTLGGFELRTLAVDPASGSVTETDLLERDLSTR